MLVWITAIALLGAIVGMLPRFSCLVSGLLLYHLAPLESLIWTPNPYVRGLTTSVIGLLTLSFSPCGDCWTILAPRRQKLPEKSGDYTWRVRLLQLYLVEIYFFSGYAKVVLVGWRWASASSIRNWMLWSTEQEQLRVFHTLGTWIADRPFVCWSLGIGTLLFEFGIVTAVFWKWPGRVLVPLAAVFHLGILLAMNLVFLNIRSFWFLLTGTGWPLGSRHDSPFPRGSRREWERSTHPRKPTVRCGFS